VIAASFVAWVGGWFAVARFGVIGAAASTATAIATANVLSWNAVRRGLGINTARLWSRER
ncbi:hypothetical protein D6833_09200, partial [Candidatus Parcubacteria bacterium]